MVDAQILALDEQADALRPHYRRFLEPLGDEVLMTAHSHQAWPDASRDGQLACWDEAAQKIDGKWGTVFSERLVEFQRGVASRLGSDRPQDLAVAPNTHELDYRLLSCFPRNARVLTTDSEFHSLNRQLRALEPDGLQVQRVKVDKTLEAQLLQAPRPDLVAISQVMFTTSEVIPLQRILAHFAKLEVPVLIDAYHAYCALPMNVQAWPGQVFVVGGGYKYAQTGEGACWMLLPKDASAFAPRYTGWFSDFGSLEKAGGSLGYGEGGYRFLGSTFDPSGLYRGIYVMRWMDAQGLTVERLRELSLARTQLLIDAYDHLELSRFGLSLETPREPTARGGFITFHSDRAGELCERLATRRIRTDHRGPLLRFGPGPYTGGTEIIRAMETLAQLCKDPGH